MPKINVYLPDALAVAVKEAGVPVSAVCQAALVDAVERVGRARQAIAALRDPATPTAGIVRLGEALRSRMTPRLVTALHVAATTPDGPNAASISSIDLLSGVLDDGENLAVRLLLAVGVDLDALREAVRAGGADEPMPSFTEQREDLFARLTMPARTACATALEMVVELGHNYVGCEHLLIGLAAAKTGAADLLGQHHVDPGALRKALAGAVAGVVRERSGPADRTTATLDEITRRLDAIERRLAGDVTTP